MESSPPYKICEYTMVIIYRIITATHQDTVTYAKNHTPKHTYTYIYIKIYIYIYTYTIIGKKWEIGRTKSILLSYLPIMKVCSHFSSNLHLSAVTVFIVYSRIVIVTQAINDSK